MLDDYLRRVRAALAGSGLEVDEVVEDIRAHVRDALAEGRAPAGEAAVLDALQRLGEPESWIGNAMIPPGPGDSGQSKGVPLWQGLGVFGLTVLGIGAFPWVGPVILLVAWIAARAVVAAGRPALSERLRWLVYPAIVLFVGLVALVVAVLPLFPLSEIAVALDVGPPVLLTIAGLVCWWVLLWAAAKMAKPVVVWLARPLLDD